MDPHDHDKSANDTPSAWLDDSTQSNVGVPSSKRVPDDFGGYRFMGLLGKGAFGQVFKVWSSGTHRYEAMKVLHQVGSVDSEQLSTFEHEVRRMANVRSVNVVQVYHVDVLPDGRPFFTMEYLGGGRLDQYCDRTRRSLDDRIRAVADICEAVHKMHELNLVHCDIKPANIVVEEDQGVMTPKLVDFGLASQRAFRPSPTNALRGTLRYMSPEQLESRGGDPERRWDIYALGVTFYQLMVGECPIDDFPDPTLAVELLAEHLRRTPVPSLSEKLSSIGSPRSERIASARRLDVDHLRRRLQDSWLDAIARKALAKESEERFASAAEMAASLRQFLEGDRPSAAPPTVRDLLREFGVRHRKALIGSAFVVMLAVAIVFGYASRVSDRNARLSALLHEASAAVDPRQAIESYEEALAVDPARSDIRLHLAAARAAHGDLDEALATARSITQDDTLHRKAQALISGLSQFRGLAEPDSKPRDATAAPRAGDEYYYALSLGPEEAQLAVTMLGQALQSPGATHEERFRIRIMRAMRYFQMCDFDAMGKESEWLVETSPASAVAWNLRGLAHWNSEQFAQALSAYDKAVRINPEYAAAHLNRAFVHNDLGDYSRALANCDRAAALRPSLDEVALGVRILAWIGTGNRAAAGRACDEVARRPSSVLHAHIVCSRFWHAEENWEHMWVEYDRVVTALKPSGMCKKQAVEALLGRGLSATNLGRYPDAIHDFDEAEALDPEGWHDEMRGSLFRGEALLLEGSLERAVSDLEDVVLIMQDHGDTNCVLIQLWIWDALLTTNGKSGAAVVLEAAGTDAKTVQRLSNIVGHCGGTVSVDALLADAGDDPDKQTEAYYYLGLAAKARGDFARAAEFFSQCRALGVRNDIEYRLIECQLADAQLAGLPRAD